MQRTKTTKPLLFGKRNYQLMLLGIAVITLGFVLMAGKTDIISPTKIIAGPLVVLTGFGIEFWAIFKR